MNGILLGTSVLVFAVSAGILLYVRKGLVQYTTQLMGSLDAILAGEKALDLLENQDTLDGKLQAKLVQLGEMMEQKARENLRQREQLETIISDISHQVKTPIANI